MGTYNYTKEMLIEELRDFLNDIEGDFTQRDLKESLEFCKDYPYVSDKNISDKKWIQEVHKLLNKQEE